MQVPVQGSTVIRGTLCAPIGATTAIVLVPGATYDQTYWDFPYDPGVYNARQAFNRAGYTTLTLDRLGTGTSSRPLSLSVTSTLQARAVHDVITALRAGAIGDRTYGRVVLGAHSLGSVVAVIEAATYHDEDALLVTGLSHKPNYLNLAELVAVT